MKRTLLCVICSMSACAAAFAQGKITLQNDAGSLVTLTPNLLYVLPPDIGLAGHPVGNSTPLQSGGIPVVSLYGGTSSSSLSLITTVMLNNPSASAGQIPSTQLILPNIPGGQTAWFQLRIWSDPAYASYEAALAAGGPIYFGESPEFSMIPGSNVTYPSPINSPGTTWVEAPLYIGLVPEPSVLRLAGLAGSLVWLFRRARKQRCGSNSCGSEQGFLTAL